MIFILIKKLHNDDISQKKVLFKNGVSYEELLYETKTHF